MSTSWQHPQPLPEKLPHVQQLLISQKPPVPPKHSINPFRKNQGAPLPENDCEDQNCQSGKRVPRYFCISCSSTYCDNCWSDQRPHEPGKVGIDGLPHEKTDRDIYEQFKQILEPPEDSRELKKLHLADADTTWFGMEKDNAGQPIFQDHGRYAAIMAETKQPNASTRYPQLVSFVGQTGAGKSTLIKMLIALKSQKLRFGSNNPFKSPVAGSIKNDKSPTSGDVHLYSDPETAFSELPLMYADCEGLDGGEIQPVASKFINATPIDTVTKLFTGKKRTISYAKPNSETSTRDWAVRHLYPRLLFNFSDVIVFVLRNPRAFESTALSLLLDWASTSVESAVNQPVLPHAIIVLNATDTSVNEEEWDVSKVTESLMAHVAGAVNEDRTFVKYAEHWRKKGRKIKNMLDLVRCYYADIRVVRVPGKGRFMLADRQIKKLHDEIVKGCDASFRAKSDAHMMFSADQLNNYLQAGFDHFSANENQPFNFVAVALKNNPIPRDFGDHVLNMAVKIQEVTAAVSGPKMFESLSYLVASCILIDCIRQHRPGRATELFDLFYLGSCIAALEHFCDKHWPCSYISRKSKACVNSKATHNAKGHQNKSGKIIGSGPYTSSFSSLDFTPTWINMIKANLRTFESELTTSQNSSVTAFQGVDAPLAHKLHRRNLDRFYQRFDNYQAYDFISQLTCFSCLVEVPQHPLPCGHVLCTQCIKAYGKRVNRNSVTMNFCPLHKQATERVHGWVFHFKPDFAGVRILTLDGGGIRGIVELEILRTIEQALGGKIRLQAFFDLIVGTSTGGIIALGLGAKQWSVDHCMAEFTRLCNDAFTPREFDGIWAFDAMTTMKHGSKYKTKPLYDALQSVFGSGERLYGGRKTEASAYDTKVAVTATSETGEEPLVLANYNRQEESETNYKFQFPHDLDIWQAAGATSAAPRYFKPFRDWTNKRVYLDGAIYNNNPVNVANLERGLLWPDVDDHPPDILLSLGTAQNGISLKEELDREMIAPANVAKGTSRSHHLQKERKRAKKRKSSKNPFQFVTKWFEVLINRIDKILDAELTWREFKADVIERTEDESCYIRINPDLKEEPPALDEKKRLMELQLKVRRCLETSEQKAVIEDVAHRLIASTFYFIKDERISMKKGSKSYICKGIICCRFDADGSDVHARNLRCLGELLREQQSKNRQPFFTVKETMDAMDTNKTELTEDVIDRMITRAEFRLDAPIVVELETELSVINIYISLCGSQPTTSKLYPISGFPRRLITEDKANQTRLEKRTQLIRDRRYNNIAIARDPKVISPAQSAEDVTRMSSPPLTNTSSVGSARRQSSISSNRSAGVIAELQSGEIQQQQVLSAPQGQNADTNILQTLRARSHVTQVTTVVNVEEISMSQMKKIGLLNDDEDSSETDSSESDGPPESEGHSEN